MRQWERVDAALDILFAADPAMTTFHRNDIAAVLGVRGYQASEMLSGSHKEAQVRGVTRYVVAAREYGRASRWFVLAAPGAAIGTAERRRLTMGHGEHIAIDAARRIVADISSELDPALVHHPAVQAYLAHATASMEAQVRLLVSSVQNAVALVESLTGEAADRTSVKAV